MADSGTCNVCSAPCTSCMHFNRLGAGVKTETFSGEAFCENTSSQHSANTSSVLNPLKKHAFDNIRDTANATSSHESLSENIETRRTYKLEEVGHMKSGKDIKECSIPDLGDSSFPLVDTKLDLRGLDNAENDKGSPVVSSDVSDKPKMKAELKTERDNNYIPEESLDALSASRGTSNDAADLTDVTEPSSESNSGNESEEVVEQDVNICDICGDAGREELLATCSGCSDGAEHTYCMQEKMDKVPEGQWFCEECRLAEKIHKQCDIGDEVVKVQPLSRLRSLNRHLSLKLDSKVSSVDGNGTDLYSPGSQSRKRQLERVESSTGPKRRVTETEKDLSVASNPRRLSRDGSFKGGSREKVNQLNQPSHVINNVSSRPQTHKGLLSKSNSHNSASLKSKEKSFDDIPHKKKTHRERSDAQDGVNKFMSRSMSLKPVHLGRLNADEPKVIMLSPKSSRAPEIKGFKKSREHIHYDRKKPVKDEGPSSMSGSLPSALEANRNTSCENGFVSTDHNSRDPKATHSYEKEVPPSKLTVHTIRSASDLSEKKLNKPHNKDESTSGTWAAAKHISNMDAILNPELLPPQDASYQAMKKTDNNLKRPRVGKLISGSNLCQRCKEPITAAHVCMTSSPRLSASEPSTVKIPVDDIEKMNPVKAALHAAFLKKPIVCQKRRAPDHEKLDEPAITPNSNGQNSVKDVWSGSNNTMNTISAEKIYIQNLPLVACQESSIDNLSHSAVLPKEMMVNADVGGNRKSVSKVMPNHSLPHLYTATSAIPVHEYIWQGDFEVNCEKVANMHPGFQAHLSTFVSPKVMEVVPKLSPRLSLTAIPRLSAWPPQFHEIGASEDNIALYFFAKDTESYERSYRILLDNMMRNDLALKGVVSDVEILIFPSSQLPQKSQRWNMLFFMWGVFRAKKLNCQGQMVGLSRNLDALGNSCIIESNVSPSIPMPPNPVHSTVSKQLNCELIRDSMSGRSPNCTQSLSKRSHVDSYEEEHAVEMECEVKPKHILDGRTAVTDRPAMLGNKGIPVLQSSVTDVLGQEQHSIRPEGVKYFGKEEKEVDMVKIDGKIKKEDSDVNLTVKKEPSMNNMPAKDFEFGQSDKKNHCHVPTKLSCLDSDIGIGKTELDGSGSKDAKICCSTSDTRETGPSISRKKIMYDLNLDAIDMMEESGAAEVFQSAVESPQVIKYRGANSTGWDLNSSANDVQVDGVCADTESFPPWNGALPLFVGTEKSFEGGAGKKEEAPAASLSLSLALTFTDDKQQSGSNQTTQDKPPFLLFRGLADK